MVLVTDSESGTLPVRSHGREALKEGVLGSTGPKSQCTKDQTAPNASIKGFEVETESNKAVFDGWTSKAQKKRAGAGIFYFRGFYGTPQPMTRWTSVGHGYFLRM